jgi:hypothetical protein
MKRPLFAIALALGSAAAALTPAIAQAATYVVAVPVVERPIVVADWDDRWHRPDVRQLYGVVTAFGGFDMTLRVAGSPLPVHLHQGTIINPTGLTIRPGMRVRVFGHWDDGRFQANRIVLVY